VVQLVICGDLREELDFGQRRKVFEGKDLFGKEELYKDEREREERENNDLDVIF